MFHLFSIFFLWCITTVFWLISLALANATIVDTLWGLSIAFMATYHVYVHKERTIRLWVTTIFILIWGLRLSLYLFYRNHIMSKREDIRYTKLKDNHRGSWVWYSYINPFLLAMLGSIIVSLPAIALCNPSTTSKVFLGSPFDWIGILFYAIGMYFEVMADWELLLFKMDKKKTGKLYTSGLWKFTRHPNYFGECLIWWGIYFFACAQQSYWTILSPIYVTCIIYFYSGVEWNEKHMLNTRQKEYERYMQKTSRLIPFIY